MRKMRKGRAQDAPYTQLKKHEAIPVMPEKSREQEERDRLYVTYRKTRRLYEKAAKDNEDEKVRQLEQQMSAAMDAFLRADSLLPEKERLWKEGYRPVAAAPAGAA